MKHANVAFFVPHLGCPHDCSFCSQRRISGVQRAPSPQEITETVKQSLIRLGPKAQESEIAFFGGSFTAIPRGQMLSMLEAAAPYVGEGRFRGIRVSTRPDAVDANVLRLLKAYGVSAVEIGAQSMDDHVLALNARGHTAEDVKHAAALIQSAGFELGLQMMTGLQGDTPEGAFHTARELAALAPETVRIYPTVVLCGTPLAEEYKSGSYRPQSLEEAVDLCAGLLCFFEAKGIRVIRLGLHASKGIEEGYIAGPWHPAFRELCEGRLYHEAARSALAEAGPSARVLLVAPGCVSKMTGQKRGNLTALEKEFGRRLTVRQSQKIAGRQVEAAEE